jgi:hypothetical protein
MFAMAAVGIDARRWHGRQRTAGGVKAFVESLSRIQACSCRRPLAETDLDVMEWLAQIFLVFVLAIWAQKPGEEEPGVEMFHPQHRPNVAEWATAI